MRLLFLGDIHGSFLVISQYIDKYDIKDAHIVQVGDFGLGFSNFEKEKRMLEMYHQKFVKNNIHVWAIRGNHDFKPYFDNDPFGFTNIHLVSDYTVLELSGKRILCIGGAVSVDRKWRMTKSQKLGIMDLKGNESWWPDEVLVFDKEKLENIKNIDIVVTHTSPHYCPIDNSNGFGPFIENMVKDTGDKDLKTDLLFERNQMTAIFDIIKKNNNIEKHIYGHFHKSDKIIYEGVEHILLNINELYEYDTERRD